MSVHVKALLGRLVEVTKIKRTGKTLQLKN